MSKFESLRPVGVNGQHTRLVRDAGSNPLGVHFHSSCNCLAYLEIVARNIQIWQVQENLLYKNYFIKKLSFNLQTE